MRCCLKIICIFNSGGQFDCQSRTLGNCFIGPSEEHLCEIILNLNQQFRKRSHLKIVSIFSSIDLFVWLGGTIWTILVYGIVGNRTYFEFGPVIQVMLFTEKLIDDGQRPVTIAQIEPLA